MSAAGTPEPPAGPSCSRVNVSLLRPSLFLTSLLVHPRDACPEPCLDKSASGDAHNIGQVTHAKAVLLGHPLSPANPSAPCPACRLRATAHSGQAIGKQGRVVRSSDVRGCVTVPGDREAVGGGGGGISQEVENESGASGPEGPIALLLECPGPS